MIKIVLVLGFSIIGFFAKAQIVNDTIVQGSTIIIKDERIQLLEDKLLEYNIATAKAAAKAAATETTATSSSGIVLGHGYRLMVISTTDRDLAMKLRAKLFQLYPEHKQYMSFQMPNTKIKLGNFVDRGEAEKLKKKLLATKIVTNNIYILPETIEIKVEKKDPNADETDTTKKDDKVKKVEKKRKV